MINETLEQFEKQMEETVAIQTEADALKRRFTRMIRDNPLAIAVLQADKSRLDINDEYARMWRGTRKETLAKKLYDYDITVIGGDDFYACYETKKRARTDVLAKWPDGVQKYLTLNAIPILDENGEIEMAFYVWNDWTDLHDKMDEVQRAQLRMDAMIRDNPLAIAILDRNRRRVELNRAYEEVWRGTRDELLRKSISDFDVRILSGDGFFATFEERRRMFNEFVITFPDGVRKIVQLHGIPIFDDAGEVEMAFYIYVDVTEQREQMEAVRQLQQQSDAIVHKNPIPMLLCDTAMKILETNESFIDLSGYSRERVLGMKISDFDIRAVEGEGLAGVLKNKQRVFGEVTVQMPTGLFILQEWAIPLLNEKGEVHQILAVFVDITEQREKEQQVQTLMDEAQEKADILDRSIQELAAGLAAVAKGDLTYAVAIGDADPLETVKADFNSAMEAIATAIRGINRAIVQVEEGTAETSKGSEEIAKAAEQVSNTSQKCADLAKQVLDQIEDIDRQLADLSASNEEIASTSQDVLDRARKAAEQGGRAEKLGRDANVKMAAVEKIAQESVEEIEGLNAQMREINNIVRLITDIANQVNLLALNAAIEAARAGEHGRGFAVVAGEVRNLAGEAKSATGHIEKVIDGIQTSSEKTAAAIKSANAEIEVGVESVNNTIEALTTIIAETESVAHGIGEIARATEDQANSTNKVVQGMAEGTRLTKETQGQMDDLAALAEEASASTEEIGSAAHEINQMAGDLRSKMQRFRT
ncbi:methyl-accepting chemotaxis protein [Methanoculleus frigidifontis]|nr:PAS domain-containing methyl-accepting chemotaxis protein [Methanoculleus sp. FWC-SCC1]